MKLENLSQEFVQDLIPLVNSLGNLAKTASVKYKSVNFNYVPLDDIMARIKENGNFAFMQPLGTMEDGTPCIQCVLIHKSGQSIVSDPYRLRVNQNGSKQEEGSEITYSRRYSASSFFGIASDDDNDASGSEPENKKKNSILSDDTRKRLNSQIAEYKKLTGVTKVTAMLEKELGKPLLQATEDDAKKIGEILTSWKEHYTEELETGGK
jgi:hypothetical protein